MSEAFRIPSDREPLLDPGTGKIARSWFLFLSGLLARTGGVLGTGDITADMLSPEDPSSEISASIYSLRQEVEALPSAVSYPSPDGLDDLFAQLAALREQVSEMAKEIQALRSGLTF